MAQTITVNVDLTPAMLGQVSGASAKATAWAVYFNAGGVDPVWTPLTAASTPLSFQTPQIGQKIYFILQSTDSAPDEGNSVKAKITTESQIVPTGPATAADKLNYRYDSFEVTFTPAAADAGNLTDIEGFGLPMAVEVVYSNGTSATRGYNISGGTVDAVGGIWNALKDAGGGDSSIQNFSAIATGGYASSQPRMAISPATAIAGNVPGTTYSAGQWTDYIDLLEVGGATTAGGTHQIQVAGYFNGAADGNHVWHNAGFYAYDVTYDGTFDKFVLTPRATSQIQGTLTIKTAELANSIYMTLGNATVSGLANADGTGNDSSLRINTGANNEWGAVLRDFIAGFTAGYWNATATSLNGAVTATLVLNKEWNQDPTYAFGGAIASGPGKVTSPSLPVAHDPHAVVYDHYAKVFFESTNSYGNGYSDFLTRAYDVGPLINVSDGTGNKVDASDITVTLFADTDTPTGYTPQTINNHLPAGGSGYLVPAGATTSGIITELDFNVGAMSLKSGTPITIVLKGATSAADVSLPTITAFGNYTVEGTGVGSDPYVMKNITVGTAPIGIINITNLPVTRATTGTGVNWYQIEVGAAAPAQKIFNLYVTVNDSGQILNPAYNAAQAGALAIDGLAVVTGNGTGQYLLDHSGQVGINFQAGGNNTLDPSLMAPVPVTSVSLPNGAYPTAAAPLVGMRPGYATGVGAPFLESYQVWSAQTFTSTTAGIVPSTTPQTVYNGGLVFGWNGADGAAVQQRAAMGSSFVSAYTNKIGGGNVARLTFTSVSGAALPTLIVTNGGHLTATADADGNWATAAVLPETTFSNGTYTVQMQEFAASDTTFARALNGASVVQSFTVSQGTVIVSGGAAGSSLSVDTGQTSNGLTVGTSGTVTVSGGIANATMISAGGSVQMAAGTGDSGSIVIGTHAVWSGATASNTTVARGGNDRVYGTTSAASVNGGGTQVVGGGGGAVSATASEGTLNSGSYQHIKSAGWASNTTVLSGGNQIVDSGGFVMGTTVYAGGTLHVSSGGSAGSSFTVPSGPAAGQVQVAGSAVLLGGAIHVLSGGVTLGALLQSSGSVENAWAGGSAASTTLYSGTNLFVYAGGYSVAATIQDQAFERVWGAGSIATNATVLNGGYEFVYDGASAMNATLRSGGGQWVWGLGTTATNTNIQVGGTMVVHGGGFATGVTLNGGVAEINNGGSASVHINSGTVKVYQDAGDIDITGLASTVGAIDFAHIGYTPGAGGTTADWAPAGGGPAGGTLTLTSGMLHAAVTLFGSYVASNFNLATDDHGGTLVTFQTVGAGGSQDLLTLPHG